MPYIYALSMLLAAACIAGLALNAVEPRRISKPVFIDDLRRWYACKESLTAGDAAKICVFVFFFLLVIYAGPLIMTYFPQANILHYRQQHLLDIFPTPIVINGHWATSISYYFLMWPLAFIPLNLATKKVFTHSPRAWDLAQAIEAHPALSKVMTFKEKDKTFYRFQLDQISPSYVIMYHRAAIQGRELRAEKERLENGSNCDIFWIHEIKRGEIHFKLRKAELLEKDDDFMRRQDGSLVRTNETSEKRYTYFFEIYDTIKIGGGNDPLDRLDNCQTWVAAPRVLAYVDESIITEAEARKLFSEYRLKEVNGRKVKGKEIFQRHPKILKFIEEGLANGTFKKVEE